MYPIVLNLMRERSIKKRRLDGGALPFLSLNRRRVTKRERLTAEASAIPESDRSLSCGPSLGWRACCSTSGSCGARTSAGLGPTALQFGSRRYIVEGPFDRAPNRAGENDFEPHTRVPHQTSGDGGARHSLTLGTQALYRKAPPSLISDLKPWCHCVSHGRAARSKASLIQSGAQP